ncbi:MAG: hypothetical protein IT292_08525 [Deltaproteobacteria bacterium]|nr:hypothetical protein [Deltaproteobacteria bacterium]
MPEIAQETKVKKSAGYDALLQAGKEAAQELSRKIMSGDVPSVALQAEGVRNFSAAENEKAFVFLVQKALNNWRPSIVKENGNFRPGGELSKAIETFQGEVLQRKDPVLGPKTIAALSAYAPELLGDYKKTVTSLNKSEMITLTKMLSSKEWIGLQTGYGDHNKVDTWDNKRAQVLNKLVDLLVPPKVGETVLGDYKYVGETTMNRLKKAGIIENNNVRIGDNILRKVLEKIEDKYEGPSRVDRNLEQLRLPSRQ